MSNTKLLKTIRDRFTSRVAEVAVSDEDLATLEGLDDVDAVNALADIYRQKHADFRSRLLAGTVDASSVSDPRLARLVADTAPGRPSEDN